jgi:hypothetical protein
MPTKKGRSDLILFSSDDPQQLVEWLCETYGLQAVLQAVAQYQPSGAAAEAPSKRAYKKRSAKKGSSKKSAKKSAGKKQAGGKGRKGSRTSGGGAEIGNPG